MNRISIKHIDISSWTLVICLALVAYSNFNFSLWEKDDKVIVSDVVAYYAYLPAAFIYDDLSLEFINNGKDLLGKNFWGKKNPNGNLVFTASCGMSMLYFPFFITAHKASQLMGYPAKGYSSFYRIALIISSFFYLSLGSIFLRKFLNKYFSKLITAITLAVIILATNMLWYATVEAPMTHVYSFALISIFLFLVDSWTDKSTITITILLGLLVGIISLVRPTNIIIVIFLIFWKISSLEDLKNRIIFFVRKWYLILMMLFMFLIIWIPQFLYWKYATGSFLYYSYPDSQGFFFLNPQFFGTLFSWRKGFLIYTPVMIFAILGFGLLYKRKNEFFWPIIIYSLINWYIISSWWDWWYGGSFGLRPLIDSYSIFAIGIATFLSWAFSSSLLKRSVLLALFFISTALSAWHYKRYHGGSIHWVAMTKEAYFNSFWTANPGPNFHKQLRNPDYKLARKGIYKYEDESTDYSSE